MVAAAKAPVDAEDKPRVPLYRTIADAVIRDIRRGHYLEGARLPTSRSLARSLEVNRATIHQALQLLKSEGWIETNKGGGTHVTRRSAVGPVLGPAPAWDRISSTLLARVVAEPRGPEPPATAHRDLSRLAPDERDFPAQDFAEILAEVAQNGSLLTYGSPFGYRPLRETLAGRLEKRGIPADPDAILIVNGAQQGLDLITRALVDPGDAVAVENPTYAGALGLFRAHRARVLSVPIDDYGPELEPLARAFAERPKFFYTMPDFHNPTGLLATPRRRSDMVALAMDAETPLVEDAFDADLLVEGALPPPLAAYAPGNVVHLGTLSKALFPGVRVGWVSGPREFVHRLAALKRIGELTSPPILQAALNLFIRRGDYDRHLSRVRARLRARLTLAHRTIVQRFPVGTRCDRPMGGCVLWVCLPDGVSGRALAEASRERGVLISPGRDFDGSMADVSAVRISVSRGTGPEIEEALEIVGSLARNHVRQTTRRAPRRGAGAQAGLEEALIQV